ncbi:glycoside hydrolase family 3 N-terminal domain-containing protein [Actinacidiphila acididurans]|uniref:Glycoside hydrolase family 3 C-terminal domain-containing protein n=1 Tax=Actinacidiphila acididurans TaxID=2784346 RepID=A0ABS2TUA2_9ACTN|nr:glycoside hydrolase family 3 N-terminal domain-containing protein [Actinacidiphila acididurans]MBM9506905.1 glycoside hydrolase family 3 C-terminal domain-containing protein [Actinacidiphila acididurans]
MSGKPSRRQILRTGGLAVGGSVLAGMGLPGTAHASAPSASSAPSGAPLVDFLFRDDTADAGARLSDLMQRLTLEEKIAISTGSVSSAVPRLGLNAGRSGGGEGLHGVKDSKHATVFPSPLGMSQSWDEDLFQHIGDIVATESLADNGPTNRLVPVLDILRDPRAGRAYESMGEDAHLIGTLGRAMTGAMNQRSADGYQQFLPTLKHFLGYNNEINRLWTNTVMPPRVAREYYVKSFWLCIASGNAKSVMTCYHLVNGKPVSVSPFLQEMLQEWTPDFEGTGHHEFRTVNDYGSGSSMWVHSQRYFADDPTGRSRGSAQGVRNGQMSWSFRSYGDPVAQIYDALARGLLTEQDLDDNAQRSLALSLRLGDLDQLRIRSPYIARTAVTRSSLLPGNRPIAMRASQEQIVLLKNDDDTLPLRGKATRAAVLLGSMGEEVLKDHYTGNWAYAIPLKDALQNKLGAGNVHYSRAVDTVALKASNGKYLKSANNAFSEPGSSTASDTPVLAAGTPKTDNAVQSTETDLLFEVYDYGGLDKLLRTPVNDRFVQVPHVTASPANGGALVNNTSAPGQASLVSGATQYVNYQKLRLVPTPDGKYGLYSPVAGDGANNSYGLSAMAYDQDDEDVNNGSYLRLITSGAQAGGIVADTTEGHVGPYRDEQHTGGPDIATAPFDRSGSDTVADSLPGEYTFDLQSVQTSEQAIESALAGAPADAPVLLVVGYEPHLNAREAVDLYRTGLSDQQMRNIDYLTGTKGRDVVLIVKTGSPMTIDKAVHDNPRVKAIVEIGHSGQEEGSALVSALFDDGYSVPATGWAPTADVYQPYGSYSAYPGHLGTGGSVPAYSPAGRLTATWYESIASMTGASEDHPPESYRWPAYDEAGNDNLGNLNGTVPTGLLTYDIIKGGRTYQYFTGDALYPFGYGLTYTSFAYSDLKVSKVAQGTFTVSGRLTNTGQRVSDEVVQIYSRYTGTASRIVQPNNRLIAFGRLRGIAPGESRRFSYDIDLQDKLGVWDVETGAYIVEPGAYRIKAAKSSSDAGKDVTLQVTTANGGRAAAHRDLNRQALAEDFDDYSDLGGRMTDIELLSASDAFHSDTAVEFRHDGAWIAFKDVAMPAGTKWLTLRAGSDRTGTVKVYALPAGSPATALKSASPLASFPVQDTRPVPNLPTGLGRGPIAVSGQPYGNLPYPGSPAGQNGKDAGGQPYRYAYIKPGWMNTAAKVSAPSRSGGSRYDVYVVAERRGTRLEWLKFGTAQETTQKIAIAEQDTLDSIRERGGTLALSAELTPATSVSPVQWSVSAPNGSPTRLATINAGTGVLQATGGGNGTVLVTATSGDSRATREVLVTNQRAADQVTIGAKAMTVDYILLRTGSGFGPNDNIQRFKGTNQQTAVYSGLFSENPNAYYLAGTYLTVPDSELKWQVTGTDGGPTALATVDAVGLVTATGTGDGEVVVTATLVRNPDITGRRVLTLTNQAPKNAYTMIQAENYDATTGDKAAATTWGFGGNQFGLQIPMPAGSTWTYRNVDFGHTGPDRAEIRLAPDDTTRNLTVQIWADAPTTASGGTLLATVQAATSGNNVLYDTFTAQIAGKIAGVHDIFLTPSAPTRLNWFAFAAAAHA